MPADFGAIETQSYYIEFSPAKWRRYYVLWRTETLFAPSIAPGVCGTSPPVGVNAFYFEIDSELGRSASGPGYAKWSPVLRQFLEPLMSERC